MRITHRDLVERTYLKGYFSYLPGWDFTTLSYQTNQTIPKKNAKKNCPAINERMIATMITKGKAIHKTEINTPIAKTPKMDINK